MMAAAFLYVVRTCGLRVVWVEVQWVISAVGCSMGTSFGIPYGGFSHEAVLVALHLC